MRSNRDESGKRIADGSMLDGRTTGEAGGREAEKREFKFKCGMVRRSVEIATVKV
jgi:hypothetical protein